ncbi:DUF2806 domain-containing protein [Pseudomonas sp. 15FMM2]|uniref:DUF2806 domain-containing protein n=1 Tax=Pseudomonas imrae TaxID=2992837 RepID=A0ACC7PIP3_9PSED
MNWPGEQLLIRLWDTLAEKGVGSVLKPRQLVREGLALITVERAKKLVEAQTQREVDEISAGKRDVSDFEIELKFLKSAGTSNAVRIEPTISYEDLARAVKENLINDAVRKEVNTVNTILHAEYVLREDQSLPPKEKVDEDWLFRWKDYTSGVSDSDLQKMWGKVLAGEIKAPGSYSLRCLDFLRNLSHADAKLIEVMCGLILDDKFIWRPRDCYSLSLDFSELLELEELGVIGGVGSALSISFTDRDAPEPDWVKVIVSGKKCLVIRHSDKNAVLPVNAYTVTKLGRQLVKLGSFNPDLNYLKAFGSYVVKQGYSVYLADLNSNDDEAVSWFNERPLS